MAGYIRNDTSNNIATGNIINSADLDGEFDALQSAFVATTGHNHDGTTGSGAPISTIGPTQEIIVTTAAIRPSADNTIDLGTSLLEFKDLYIDGTANIDSLVADTADINGGTIDNATIANSDITVGSGKTLNVSAGTLTLADNQISGDKVEGGTINAITITTLTSTTVNATTVDTTNLEVTTIKAKDGTTAGTVADTTGVVTLTSLVATTADVNGGTVDGTTIGGSVPAAGTFSTLSSGSVSITGGSISGITDLAVADGGTGVSTLTGIVKGNGTSAFSAATAGTDYLAPAAIGATVQAWDTHLDQLAALTPTAGNFIVGNGTAWVRETPAQALVVLGVTATAAELNTLDGVTASTAELNLLDGKTAQDFFPSGGIIIWSGSAAAIPSGWLLCNGASGTPDLRDRFVVGAGLTYAVGDTGGQNSISAVPAHTHGVGNLANTTTGAHTHNVSGNTSNTGAHTHSGATANAGDHAHNGTTANSGNHGHGLIGTVAANASATSARVSSTGNGPVTNNNVIVAGGDHAHNFTTANAGVHAHNFSTNSDGAHSHTITGTGASAGDHAHTISGSTASTGNASVDTRPPYYALCYIMKG
jgi:hypothetical protein